MSETFRETARPAGGFSVGEPAAVRQAKSRVELEMIREALQRFDGNKKRAAEYLGISRSHLYKKINDSNIL